MIINLFLSNKFPFFHENRILMFLFCHRVTQIFQSLKVLDQFLDILNDIMFLSCEMKLFLGPYNIGSLHFGQQNFMQLQIYAKHMSGVTTSRQNASNFFYNVSKKSSVTLKVLITVQKYLFKLTLKFIPKFPEVSKI